MSKNIINKFIKVTFIMVVMGLIITGCSNDTPSESSSATGPKTEKKEVNSTGDSDKVITIKVGHVGAPESPQQSIGEMFAKNVAEATNNTVEIKLYGNSQLGSEKDLQQGVKAGTIDGVIAGTFANFVSWTGVLEAPLLYRDMDHFMKVYNGEVGKELMASIEEQVGVKPLFIAPHGSFRYITNSVRPIIEPSDMEGLKLRDPDVPAYSVVARSLGATPVPMDFSELYTALDRKVVDGQHNPMSHIIGSNFYEVQDYLSMVPYGIPPHVVSISQKVWDSLSTEQQEQVMIAAQKTAKDYPIEALKANDKLVEEAIAAGMEVSKPEDVDVAAFQKIFKEVAVPELYNTYGEDGEYYIKKIMETK